VDGMPPSHVAPHILLNCLLAPKIYTPANDSAMPLAAETFTVTIRVTFVGVSLLEILQYQV
jgi:hypothetical protein